MKPIVLRRENAPGETVAGRPYQWRHYIVILPNSDTVIVDMTPALIGWNFGRVTHQRAAEAWPNMTPEQVRDWALSKWARTELLSLASQDAQQVIERLAVPS